MLNMLLLNPAYAPYPQMGAFCAMFGDFPKIRPLEN